MIKRLFLTIILCVSSISALAEMPASVNENFAWTIQNLNTLVAMGCIEKYSRVKNQNDPSEFLVYNWSWQQQGEKTIFSGSCGLRFNSKYEIIPDADSDIEFAFDRSAFASNDKVVIEGRIGGQGIKFYFDTRTGLDQNSNLVFIKSLTSVSIMNTLGMTPDSFLRKRFPMIESAIKASEQLHGAPTYHGVWSQANGGYTLIEGANDRFGLVSAIFSAQDSYGYQRILYRGSDRIRNNHIMSSIDDDAEAIFKINRASALGCSFFNERGARRISYSQCEQVLSKLH